MDKHCRLGALRTHRDALTAEISAAGDKSPNKQKLTKQLKNVQTKIDKITAELNPNGNTR